MIDLLLLWYAVVAIGTGASIYVTTREPEKKAEHVKMLPPWLANLAAHTEPIEGYQDPLFFADSERKNVRTKQKH